MSGIGWVWPLGFFIAITGLKIVWPSYVRSKPPPWPNPEVRRGFLVAGAIVFPIGRFVYSRFKDEPHDPATICLDAIRSNIDDAQGLALFGAILSGSAPMWFLIGGGLLMLFQLGRASGFWSALRRIENAQRLAPQSVSANG
ncbi:MAG TPA: hypothetical protein VMU59_14085 [Caulobacteraceae bacterium]|nr:hypothetical protein [Caulobacteraceae bacterium]